MNQKLKQTLLSGIAAALMVGCGGGGGGAASTDPTLFEPPVTASSLPLLVIRLQYHDATFTNSAVTWSDKIFGNNFHQLNHYYNEASAGQFAFSRVDENEGIPDDGVITVTLDKNHPDPSDDNLDAIHPDLKAALIAAAPYIDFASYDTNHNGKIAFDELQVIFIVAGYEDAYSGGTQSPGIWAHSYCTQPINTPNVDGVSLLGCSFLGSYAVFGERHDTHDATIGIIAHELGHAAFWLSDLYDVDGSSAGIGYFGLMGTGSGAYAAPADTPGNTPSHLNAWSKTRTGWFTPQIVSGLNDQSITLNESASTDYNILKLPITPKEYFLLENRNNSGYDAGLYALGGTFAGGLAIWHIDENIIDANYLDNTVNNDETHKGVDLEEAANAELDIGSTASFWGNSTNLYYAGNVDRFAPDTTPNSDSYAGSSSGIYVENISSRGSSMTLLATNPN